MVTVIYNYVKNCSEQELERNIDKAKLQMLDIFEFEIGIPFVHIGPKIKLSPIFKRFIKNKIDERKANLLLDAMIAEKRNK